jgi:hypothetical protein
MTSLDETFNKKLQTIGMAKIGRTKRVLGVEREAVALVGGVTMTGRKRTITVAEIGAGTNLGGGVEIVTMAAAVKIGGGMERDIVTGRRVVGSLTGTTIEGTMTIGTVTRGITEIVRRETGEETDMMTETTTEDETTETDIEMT